MKQHRKVTYTLDKGIIDIIEKRSFLGDISMSKFVSNCIVLGYEMMIDGYYENNKQQLVGVIRKRRNTIPKTFTLPIDVIDTLNFFSDKLDVKKSHLVRCCIRNFEIEESERLSKQIDELMKSVEITE
jgi:hypothetical protein